MTLKNRMTPKPHNKESKETVSFLKGTTACDAGLASVQNKLEQCGLMYNVVDNLVNCLTDA